MELINKLSRRERIYQQLSEMTQQITLQRIEDADFQEHDATGIGKALNITINNTCMELNVMVKAGQVIKILGRPVYFFSREDLEQILGHSINNCVWENIDQFKRSLKQPPTDDNISTYTTHLTSNTQMSPMDKSFQSLVGAEHSLKKSINQAKSAVLYPPNGLHTLLTGETGTGKSHFAEAMYDFAVEIGQLPKDANFVIYNCASYSENPQLLLSQLFGYKKGAFTGADRDCPGIIDQANGGLLFLDEAHRLSPEGQEKMFLLIDKGIFQRLGETQTYREAKIRIIAATTEDPQKALLPTFLRRIPIAINIPPLEKRSFEERLRFIFRFIYDEAHIIQRDFMLNKEVISSLMFYRCRGNIGQLRGDVKCLCANAYLDHYCTEPPNTPIYVELTHLPDNVEIGLCDISVSNPPLFQRYRIAQEPYTFIDHTQQNCESHFICH